MIFRVAVLPANQAHAAVKLAQRELNEHLSAACRAARFAGTRVVARAQFVLGTFDDLGAGVLGETLKNDRWIDRVIVRSDGGRVILAGSNPRSVLFAVYSYLDALGFAWVTPGDEGAVRPRLDVVPLDGFAIDHTASLIYRGIGLAGAFDGERGERFVQWMARNRLNYLFMEGSTRKASYQQELGATLTAAQAARHDKQVLRAAKQRGLLCEKMGHGWTSQVLNAKRGGGKAGQTFTPTQLAMAAEKDGQRAIKSGNTQLCLSNVNANALMVKHVAAYAADHAEVDVLGVWMADGFNNWCECAKCAKVHPSDLWVRLINRIAARVHKVRPDLRIEVLGYAALMEPPPNECIDNRHGNVIFMYAPFIRCYTHRLDDPACVSVMPLHTFPPVNKLHHPMNYEYFTFLQGWLKRHKATNYVFDYYCWLPIKRDIFEGNVAQTMCRDLNRYPENGLHGMIDCSRAQSFWPTPLARWVQARTSWDASADYAAERDRLLALTYGNGAGTVDAYLTLAYDCLSPSTHGREEERDFDPTKVRRFKRPLPGIQTKLAAAIDSAKRGQKKMLKRVAVHAAFTALHLDQLLAEKAGKFDESMALATRMHELARQHRRLLDGFADPPEFAWLERDTHKRLQRKKDGTWMRID